MKAADAMDWLASDRNHRVYACNILKRWVVDIGDFTHPAVIGQGDTLMEAIEDAQKTPPEKKAEIRAFIDKRRENFQAEAISHLHAKESIYDYNKATAVADAVNEILRDKPAGVGWTKFLEQKRREHQEKADRILPFLSQSVAKGQGFWKIIDAKGLK